MRRMLSVLLMFCCVAAHAQDSISVRLRDQGQLYTTAADTLDLQAATIANQAAKIVELEQRIAELRGDLKASDFTFQGRVNVPIGMTCSGLAHDPATGWWYSIGAAGNNPFALHRFKINLATLDPATVGVASQVESVGSINNAADVLKMSGQALVNCKGLMWEGGDTLLVNYCSYYANSFNLNFLCRYNVATKTVVGGPWMVDNAISSETTKGMTFVSPPKLAAATGLPLLCFGVRGSTPQKQSYGPGFVALGNPVTSPVPAKIVAHWPMKIWPGSNPVIPYSDYPNDAAMPVIYLQRAADGSVIKTPMTGGSYFGSGCVVKGKFVITFGSVDGGNRWYGNFNDFQDVPSAIDPTKPTLGNGTYRGGYVEMTAAQWSLFRDEDLAASFAAGNKLIVPYATGRMDELGGGHPVPLQSNSFGQSLEFGDRVAVLCHGVVNGGNAQILVFGVK